MAPGRPRPRSHTPPQEVASPTLRWVAPFPPSRLIRVKVTFKPSTLQDDQRDFVLTTGHGVVPEGPYGLRHALNPGQGVGYQWALGGHQNGPTSCDGSPC